MLSRVHSFGMLVTAVSNDNFSVLSSQQFIICNVQISPVLPVGKYLFFVGKYMDMEEHFYSISPVLW